MSKEEIVYNKKFKEKLIEYLYNSGSLCAYCEYKHLCDNTFRSDGNGNPIFAPCSESLDCIDLNEASKELKEYIEQELLGEQQ